MSSTPVRTGHEPVIANVDLSVPAVPFLVEVDRSAGDATVQRLPKPRRRVGRLEVHRSKFAAVDLHNDAPVSLVGEVAPKVPASHLGRLELGNRPVVCEGIPDQVPTGDGAKDAGEVGALPKDRGAALVLVDTHDRDRSRAVFARRRATWVGLPACLGVLVAGAVLSPAVFDGLDALGVLLGTVTAADVAFSRGEVTR